MGDLSTPHLLLPFSYLPPLFYLVDFSAHRLRRLASELLDSIWSSWQVLALTDHISTARSCSGDWLAMPTQHIMSPSSRRCGKSSPAASSKLSSTICASPPSPSLYRSQWLPVDGSAPDEKHLFKDEARMSYFQDFDALAGMRRAGQEVAEFDMLEVSAHCRPHLPAYLTAVACSTRSLKCDKTKLLCLNRSINIQHLHNPAYQQYIDSRAHRHVTADPTIWSSNQTGPPGSAAHV